MRMVPARPGSLARVHQWMSAPRSPMSTTSVRAPVRTRLNWLTGTFWTARSGEGRSRTRNPAPSDRDGAGGRGASRSRGSALDEGPLDDVVGLLAVAGFGGTPGLQQGGHVLEHGGAATE